MTNDETAARRIVQIMKDANTGADDIMMRGSIDARFMRDGSDHRQILAGYHFAADRGWIKLNNVAITLTAAGHKL